MTQRDLSNCMNLRTEPADHTVGRLRGGLGTKIHQLSDGNGRRLVLLIGEVSPVTDRRFR